jgi:hypothetical protein
LSPFFGAEFVEEESGRKEEDGERGRKREGETWVIVKRMEYGRTSAAFGASVR